MLRNIILIFTGLYIEEITGKKQLRLFVQEMEQQGWNVLVEKVADEKRFCCEYDFRETLFISDDAGVLKYLHDKGGFTIACYHEGVTGLMGTTQYAIEGIVGIEPDYMEKVYQRYCGIPWQIAKTKRLTVREMGPDDLDELYELYADERVTKYTEPLFVDKDMEKHYIEDYVENIYKYFGFGTWLVHRKEDGKLIGRAGFNFRPGFDEPELGFVTGYPFWRKGYAYEVCSHLLYLGKTVFEFGRIQALADKENMASVCLLEKLGFYYVGDVVVDGQEYRRYLFD